MKTKLTKVVLVLEIVTICVLHGIKINQSASGEGKPAVNSRSVFHKHEYVPFRQLAFK